LPAEYAQTALAQKSHEDRLMLEEQVRGRIRFKPTPDWVEETPFARPSEALPHYKTQAGFYTWLVDDQVRILEGGPERYHRSIEEVVNLSALHEIANIQLDFEPDYHSLDIHHIKIHRKDEVHNIDIAQRYFVLRRAAEFEQLVLDGSWTLAVTLPDVRVGDIVDIALTISGDPKVFEGHFILPQILQSWIPQAHRKVRYLLPPEKRIHLYPFANGWVEPKVRERDDGFRDIVFEDHEIAPAHFERSAPSWVVPVRGVYATSINSWSEVADLMRKPFEISDPMPEGLRTVLSAIESEHSQIEDRVVAVVNYVQSHIRYFAFAFGEGGFVPRSLAEIHADRIGDCKDVSKMIVAMLRALGVEANVALVDFQRGFNLVNTPPRIGCFNHAIASAVISGKTYWFEGTAAVAHYGDLEHMSQPDLGYALILKPNSQLVRMNDSPPKRDYEINERIVLPSDPNRPTEIHIDYIHRGAYADQVRSALEHQSLTQFVQDRCSLFGFMYGMNMCAIPEMTDDRKRNELIIKTSVVTEDPWRDTGIDFEREFITPESAYGHVVDEPAGRRQYPFDLGQRREVRVTTLIETDWQLDLPMEPRKWEYGGLRLYFKAQRTAKTYQAIREYVVDRTHLTPDEKSRLDKDYDDISAYERIVIKRIDRKINTWAQTFSGRVALWAGLPLLGLGAWVIKSLYGF